MKKRLTKLGILILSISIFLTACGGGNKDPDSDGDVGSGEEGSELVVAQVSDATTLDPQDSNDQPSGRVFRHFYNNLVKYSMDMEIEPDLAKSWEQVDDLTWEFEIVDDAVFHNGEDLTTEDVKYTLERHMDSPVVGHMLEAIDEIEIVDDYNFKIITKEPFAALLPHLTHNSAGILNKKAVEEKGDDYGMEPVGTGPYKFVSWDSGDSIVMERNEDYFGEEPDIEKVTFEIIPEGTQRAIALETGEVDIAYQIEPIDRSMVEGNEELELIETPAFSIQYMGFNTSKEPFDDPIVRKAIAHAIDIDNIISTALEGSGEKAAAPLQKNVPGSNPDLEAYEYDLDKAKELMKEAGHEDGFEAELWTNDNPVRVRIAEMIQAELKEIGIDVKVMELEWGAYLEGTETGNQEMYMLGWSVSTGDADHGLGSLYHSKNVGAGGNRSFYENKEVDELLDKGSVEKDIDQRIKYYQEAQEIIMEDLPILPLYFDENTAGIKSNVKGFEIHPAGHIMLDTVYFE